MLLTRKQRPIEISFASQQKQQSNAHSLTTLSTPDLSHLSSDAASTDTSSQVISLTSISFTPPQLIAMSK